MKLFDILNEVNPAAAVRYKGLFYSSEELFMNEIDRILESYVIKRMEDAVSAYLEQRKSDWKIRDGVLNRRNKMREKMTTREIAFKVEDEGLGYAIQHYMSGEDIEDPELARLWDQASDMLNNIERILDKEFWDKMP